MDNKENKIKTISSLNFSEEEILQLQDFFLDKKINYIKVKDLEFGRKFIYKFLNSMKMIKSSGYFSLCRKRILENVLDIYSLINNKKVDNNIFFNLDFIWLEIFFKIKNQDYLNFVDKIFEKIEIKNTSTLIMLIEENAENREEEASF